MIRPARRRWSWALGDERGQASVLIIGAVFVLGMAVALVVNTSAAYLQRQALNSLADGAALHGVEGGIAAVELDAMVDSRLRLDADLAGRAVRAYLVRSGATARYPGLRHQVSVEADGALSVRVTAPLELPLRIPGSPPRTVVGSSARAAVTVVE